jgi:hypothetical protein
MGAGAVAEAPNPPQGWPNLALALPVGRLDAGWATRGAEGAGAPGRDSGWRDCRPSASLIRMRKCLTWSPSR